MTRLARLALVVLAVACGPKTTAARDAHREAARLAAEQGDREAAGEWLLTELIAPGGTNAGAARARDRLKAANATGMLGSLARALDADVHGDWPTAAVGYLDVLVAAQRSERPDAPLVAWFAASRAEALRHSVSGSWARSAAVVKRLSEQPGNIGWRARLLLSEWQAREEYRRSERVDAGEWLARLARDQGCVSTAKIAGPFGRRRPGDHRVRFDAEGPAPWPLGFASEGGATEAVVANTEARGCGLASKQHRGEGIHYVQTFIDLDAPRDAIVAIPGAFAILVDDVEVFVRDEADWGSWPRLGVRMRLVAGRHRIVARIGRPETSIRVLTPAGQPLPLSASSNDTLPYVRTPPTVLDDPNPLEPHLRAHGVRGYGRVPDVDTRHPVARYVAGAVASLEGYRDLANVLVEPLVDVEGATPVALSQSAQFTEQDPILSPNEARTRARDGHARAVAGDASLWASRAWLLADRAPQERPADAAVALERLVEEFPRVPVLAVQLAALHEQLGWYAEQARVVNALVQRFPEDVPTLETAFAIAERQGRLEEAERFAARVAELDPTNELAFRRALRRGDFIAAADELRRIESIRSDRRDLAARIAEVLVRAGRSPASGDAVLRTLELAVERDPRDSVARLALADERRARGDRRALEDALLEAIRSGADTGPLRQAIELAEGATALEPYRKDGLAIIRDAESRGITLPGTAARVLDYSALWIAADGSARMLEHTILRVQSREGIARHSEQRLPQGVVLKMRTVKKDGRIFEPEIVPGKPTATMPHLEVGDFIETESIWLLEGDGEGRRFRSPRWFFREPNVSYHLSQFVVVSPRSRPLTIETTGIVPAPELSSTEGLEVRRWTVTGALALPEEPGSPPIEEFLPSVLVGWGVDWRAQLERVADSRGGGQPADPRLVRFARAVAAGADGVAWERVLPDERARRLYRWVVENVTPGPERWPARIVTSRSGDAVEAFLFLCRLVGVDARLAVIKSRLAPPTRGPLSDIEAYASTAVRVRTESGERWVLVGSRYAPYGFLPSFLAGQPAVLLDRASRATTPSSLPLEQAVTSTTGVEDGVLHRGTIHVSADGSARLELVEEFRGRYAIAVRTALSQIEAAGKVLDERRRELVEQRMIAPKIPGARVTSLAIDNLERLDEPLRMTLVVDAATFARASGRSLDLDVPFLGTLAPLVALPQRQTPLYLEESALSRVEFDVRLPEGARLATTLERMRIEEPRLRATVNDRLEGGWIRIERGAELPAGRIPLEDYPAFRESVLAADRALNRAIRIDR